MVPVVLSWSGGKDSALALRELRRSPGHDVVGLLTTVTHEHDRISMHGVRRELLEAQASALALPLEIASISAGAGNDAYEAEMGRALAAFSARGVRTVAFGDLFLRDVRRYREELVAGAGLAALFPLWDTPTPVVARRFIDLGYEAVITCVDTQAIDGGFAGRAYDDRLIEDLPGSADVCGENGEFHTFVTAGPEMRHPLEVRTAERVLRDGRFMFCEILPA